MIKEFFENKDIFVTGGSGVVGKALVEKLLRTCNVRKVYILLRPKKNLSIEQRLEKLKNAMIFRQLRKQKPHELDRKLSCIPGNAVLPLLGITAEYQKVLENVSIVFHCAATVRFDEPLRDALRLNVGGTLQMLKFCETLKNIEVVMHVSTFFSNPYLQRVENKVYDSPLNWKFCLSLLEESSISEDVLNIITNKLIVGFPNTYCFTKNLAESLVNDYRGKLPVGIYRPSVVLFAIEEPEKGFAPALMGAMGLFAVAGAGILKTVYMRRDVILDVTPQDVAVKCLCFYTVKTANLFKEQKQLNHTPVYISSACTHCEITFCQYIEIMQNYGFWSEAAFEKSYLIPGIYCTDNRFIYMLLVIFKQILPALIADFALVVSGRKPAVMHVQRKIFSTLEVMKPFCFNNYESPGVTDIDELTGGSAEKEFNLDVVQEVKSFYKNVAICQSVPSSVREHLLKEDPKTLPKSRKILKAKIVVYNIFKFLLAFKVYEKVVDYLRDFYYEHLTAEGISTSFCPKNMI